jgi:NAD(P)-dependent dehydrogenase (short-subunit alcohol dehydrogenase family)
MATLGAFRIRGCGPENLIAFGAIDIIVNNAAFQRSCEIFEDIPDDEFEERIA